MTNIEIAERMIEIANRERAATLEAVTQLRLVHERRAFVDMGFSSLWDFCIEKLRYSPGAAKRRIDAMFALSEHPSLEREVLNGSLSLSTVSQVQSHIRKHRIPEGERLSLFQEMVGKSARQVDVILNPQDHVELTLKLSPEIYEKFKELQSLLAHQTRSSEEIFGKLVELGLKELNPARESKRRADSNSMRSTTPTSSTHDALKSPMPSRYIPTQIRREVWKKSEGRCQYPGCDSQHALQIDHIEPYAYGGSNDPSNLRLLCRQHNLYRSQKRVTTEAPADPRA